MPGVAAGANTHTPQIAVPDSQGLGNRSRSMLQLRSTSPPMSPPRAGPPMSPPVPRHHPNLESQQPACRPSWAAQRANSPTLSQQRHVASYSKLPQARIPGSQSERGPTGCTRAQLEIEVEQARNSQVCRSLSQGPFPSLNSNPSPTSP